MSTIVTRAGKGSALTHNEVDANFTNLNTDKIQSGNTVAALTITSATINGGTITGITDLSIADGGTGASTAENAFNALAPSQTGNSGKYLTTNGFTTSWATISSAGTVTSVAATVPSFLSVTGSPITTSGTLAISYSGTALPVANGGSGQTTAQAAINTFAGATTSGQYLRGNGTNVVMSAIQAGDVPTLNQNTTGSAATVTGNATGSTFGFNSGYGSVATAYGCRAWVNFNGTGTVAIRASGNVSSITDNGTGDYTVNFTTAMPDANYCYSGSFAPNYAVVYPGGISMNTVGSGESAPTTSSFRFVCIGVNSSIYDPKYVNISVFR